MPPAPRSPALRSRARRGGESLRGADALKYLLRLVWRRLPPAEGVAPVWNHHFQDRSRAMQRAIRLDPHRALGTAGMHLSAIEIQRLWRGFVVRIPPGIRAPTASSSSRRAASRSSSAPNNVEIDLVSKFLDAKLAIADAARRDALTYRDWCAARVQAWWRMTPWRRAWLARRWAAFNVAARSLQRWWEDVLILRLDELDHDPQHLAAVRIQRRWRAFASMRIMRNYMDLIRFREQGNPRQLLRSINPREAGLMDAASQPHVRFRLGGLEWPPKIYYKIYTHAAVTDIGAFAPRDYTRRKQLEPRVLNNRSARGDEALDRRRRDEEARAGWYRRIENNGWRPVQASLLREIDEIAQGTAAKPVPFAPTRTQRRAEIEQKKRQKKIAWLQKMYRDARGGEGAEGGGAGAEAHGGDDEVDELLQWSEGLDFDSYHSGWLTLATTGRTKLPGAREELDEFDSEEEDGSTAYGGDGGGGAWLDGDGTGMAGLTDELELEYGGEGL